MALASSAWTEPTGFTGTGGREKDGVGSTKAESRGARLGRVARAVGEATRPRRYSAGALVAHGVTGRPWRPAWRHHELGSTYDAVIVGAGVHGLATAYHLARDHGVRKVAVLDKGYLGGGSSGRTSGIVWSNYLTPEGVRFYDRSLRLYGELSGELNFNVMFSPRGHLTLAHSDASLRAMRWRAEVSKLHGVDSEVVGPEEVRRLVPLADVSSRARYPIMGALYHPSGGTVRHDAVNWGYARAADALGVEIHQGTEVLAISTAGDRVTGVTTNRGEVSTPVVVSCTAGWASLVSDMVGLSMPIITRPLQAAVTEPVQVLLDAVVVSGTLDVQVSQTDRGELVLGASPDPFASYSMRGSLEFTEEVAGRVLQLMPSVAPMRLLRQWSGLCDITPDLSPIMGPTPVEGFLVDVGWGTNGFMAGPAAGQAMAELVATSRTPELMAAFDLARFAEGRLVEERDAAGVGH